MTLPVRIPTIGPMEADLDALQARTARLIEGSRRLAEHNRELRAQLAEARESNRQMERRMHDARARVEAALARLPALADGSH